MKRHLLMLLPAAVLAVGTLAACGATTSASSTAPTTSTTMSMPMSMGASAAPSASTASAMITIKNYGFTVSGPVSPGEKVSVHNDDSVTHTVTADTGNMFDVNVPASATATFTAPARAGSYAFHCTYHAEMHGMLTVR
jgi:plastocyanin